MKNNTYKELFNYLTTRDKVLLGKGINQIFLDAPRGSINPDLHDSREAILSCMLLENLKALINGRVAVQTVAVKDNGEVMIVAVVDTNIYKDVKGEVV